ncbi:MAG: hypothetical protein H0W13_03765 [Nitrospirales bacterium]|nr:hypothetical protein [Nitrospirales bacterium]
MANANIARAEQAYDLRCRQAKFQKDLPLPSHHTNGDEDRYAKNSQLLEGPSP